jgi:hypothetical protein
MKERLRYIFLDSSLVNKPDSNNSHEFKKDDEFIELLGSKYLSEVFTWILKGSIEFYKNPEIIPSQSFNKRTDEVFNSQDSVTTFINNVVDFTYDFKNDYVKKSKVLDTFNNYCKNNGQVFKKRVILYKRLEDIMGESFTKRIEKKRIDSFGEKSRNRKSVSFM